MRINREELAWAAGFFDGEGTTGSYRNGRYQRLVMAIPQKDRRPLDRFVAAVGGVGSIYLSRHGGNPIYVWQAQRFETVQAVVALLWSFWSEPKKEQAQKAFHRQVTYKEIPLDRSESSRRGWVTRKANHFQGPPHNV